MNAHTYTTETTPFHAIAQARNINPNSHIKSSFPLPKGTIKSNRQFKITLADTVTQPLKRRKTHHPESIYPKN